MPVITISRQMCSGGGDIAKALARRLGWDVITRSDLLSRFPDIAAGAYDKNMLTESAGHYLKPNGQGGTFLDSLKRELYAFTEVTSAVLVGFGSQILFAGRLDALNIRIVASREVRLERVRQQYTVSFEEAACILDQSDRKHRRFVATVFGADSSDEFLYHLTLNASELTVDECVDTIVALLRTRVSVCARRTAQLVTTDDKSDRPLLKNQSEADFAKILDMYQIDWQYEPKTFPVEWDAEGNVTMAFRPDFYLTKFDTYIELTTMDQRYVTSKNKKVRKLRELYPGTNIKVVYRKDFHALVERFRLGSGVS